MSYRICSHGCFASSPTATCDHTRSAIGWRGSDIAIELRDDALGSDPAIVHRNVMLVRVRLRAEAERLAARHERQRAQILPRVLALVDLAQRGAGTGPLEAVVWNQPGQFARWELPHSLAVEANAIIASIWE